MDKTKDTGSPAWTDPDDALELSKEAFARGEIRIGDRIIRPARRPPEPTIQ